MTDRICSVEGCERRHKARGYCRLHYTRWLRGQDIGAPDPMTPAQKGPLISAGKKGWNPSAQTRARMRAAKLGTKRTPEAIAKQVANHPKTRRRAPLTEKQRLHLIKARSVKGPTRLERALCALLTSFGVQFEEQFPIGVYTVDAFIPRLGLVIEADGAHWHQNTKKERARDRYLLMNPVVKDVLHLREEQLVHFVPPRVR